MATERRRQQLLLGILVVVLAGVVYRLWPSTSAAPRAASNRSGVGTAGSATPARQQQTPSGNAGDAPDVHLEALSAERAKPGASDRNLFRFKPKAPPPPPPASAPVRPTQPQPTAPVTTVPTGPPPPPPVPPITLKFIGIMESPTVGKKIAILSDGRGAPIYGSEGEIVDGRYRILKIGVESVELAYADGRGRQTIRLTGS